MVHLFAYFTFSREGIGRDVKTQGNAVFRTINFRPFKVNVPSVIDKPFINPKANFWSESPLPRQFLVLIGKKRPADLSTTNESKNMGKGPCMCAKALIKWRIVHSRSPNSTHPTVVRDPKIALLDAKPQKPSPIIPHSWS